MSNDIWLTSHEARQHFLTLGTSGVGLSEPLPPGTIYVDIPALPPILGCWDAIGDAVDALHDQTGIHMSREQMKRFLEDSPQLAEIIEFGEVDTVIRENLASELSEQLVGECWPTNGDVQNDRVVMDDFVSELYRAAEAAGYSVAS